MALESLVSGLTPLTGIFAAIKETIQSLLEIRNGRDAIIIGLEQDHEQAMAKLSIISEENRHQITKELLGTLSIALSELGQDFKTAKKGNDKGLPGENLKFLLKTADTKQTVLTH